MAGTSPAMTPSIDSIISLRRLYGKTGRIHAAPVVWLGLVENGNSN
jgi:hypothetical protein